MTNFNQAQIAKIKKSCGRRFAVVDADTVRVGACFNTAEEAANWVNGMSQSYGQDSWIAVDTQTI